MKALFTVSAVIEVGAGLALILLPSLALTLLFGTSLDSPAGLTVTRLAGGALLALGVGSWFERCALAGRDRSGMVAALLIYNIAAVLLFGFAGLGYGIPGIVLWLVVGLHAVMAMWCIACLRAEVSRVGGGAGLSD